MVQRSDGHADILPRAMHDVRASPAPDVGSRSRWRRLASDARTGVRFGIGGAVGLWLADLVRLACTRGAVAWRPWLTGIGAALYVAVTAGMVVGALLGPLAVPLVRDTAVRLHAQLAKLRRGDAEPRRAMAAGALALGALAACWMALAYWTAFVAGVEMARPESVAALVTGAHLVSGAVLAITWPSAVKLARSAIDAGTRMAVRLAAHRRLAVAGGIVLALAAFAGAVWVIRALLSVRSELAALPWADALVSLGAVLGWTATARLASAPPIRGYRPARVALTIAACLFAAGAGAAARLRPESTTARVVAFERALSGRLGYAAWMAAFDFDRDGQLDMLGGGDCAPFDRTRYTGAVEIPGNGIDEDCDGVDLAPNAIHPRPRMFVGQDALPLRPTIVLVTIDALGGPRLQALGSHDALMPNVDRLAASSMLFTHCFAQGPSTRLSFPSMFTSRWDSEVNQVFSPHFPYSLAPTERQLQDVLDDAGYDTAAVLPAQYFESDRWQSLTRGFQHVDTSAVAAGKHNAPQVTDAALRVLSSGGNRPLYLWVHYYDAHGPYVPLPGTVRGKKGDRELYDAELGYVDRELGRLIDAIEARPEPAYLILTADHATVFHPDPASRRAHYGYDLYSATLHVPLIVHGPHVAPGRVEGVTSTMDIAPTIVDLLHLADGGKFEGQSLWPEMLASRGDPDRVLFHQFYLGERYFRGQDPLEMVSARTSRWNLVLNRLKGSYELYDWQADYYERHDLFEDDGRRPDVMHLRSLLGSFVAQYHARPEDEAMLPPPRSDEP